MWLTSSGFAEALAGNNRIWRTRIEVILGSEHQTSLSLVVDGEVDVDDVAVRRTAKLEIADPDGRLSPADARDLLAPRGTEVQIFRGLMVDGEPEWVPLGVFGVSKPEVYGHNYGTSISFSAYDRVDAVRKRRFWEPWVIPGGTRTDIAIKDIVTSRLNVPTRITTSGHTVPESLFDALSDPWDAVRALANADGLSAYFDPLGTFVVEPQHEVMTDQVYQPGVGSLLIDTHRMMDEERTYSGVIVTGEHPAQIPIKSVLWDTDPQSPTYIHGPFGRRPYGFHSPLIINQQQADVTAVTLFERVTKMPQTVTLKTIGHPGHDVGDIVTVEDPETHTVGRYVVTGLQMPLRPGLMTMKLREATSG